MRRADEIEAEIRDVKDRQAKLLDDRGDSHREWLRLDQERGDAMLDGDDSTLQEVNRKLQDVSKQRDDLQAGITAANLRLEGLEGELQAAQQAEAEHIACAARLQELEVALEIALIGGKAREEQAGLAPKLDHFSQVAQLAYTRLNGSTPLRKWSGTVEELDAEVTRLRAKVGKLPKKALDRLSQEVTETGEARAKKMRRLQLEEVLQGVERSLLANQQQRDDLPVSNDPAFRREHSLAKIAEARERLEQEKAELEAELERVKAS